MRLFWFDHEHEQNDRVIIKDEQAKRLREVLRMKVGSIFAGRDAGGNFYQTKITDITKKEILATITDKEPPRVSSPSIELWQAIPKGSRFDVALRMAVEAGASRIVPLITEFTEIKETRNLKVERYRRIAIEASGQSGSLYFREVAESAHLYDAIDTIDPSVLAFFCHQEPLTMAKLSSILQKIIPSRIIIIIGPEGGFSHKEVELMISKKINSIHLCDTVLRSETAGIFAIAAIKMMIKEI